MDSFEETRQGMKELVKNATIISTEEFEKITAEHLQFILNGGAGGYWETLYIKNLIFGIYRGVNTNNVQGKQAKLSFNNLQEINVLGIRLPYADCSGLHCVDKSWAEADLEGCLFIDSILDNCSFQNADLFAADFSRSDMRNCNFKGASLVKTDFENCDLSGSDFRGAIIDHTTLFKNSIMQNVLMD